MVEKATKMPVKTEKAEPAPAAQAWLPFEGLRREMNRLLDEFDRDLWHAPFRRTAFDIEPFWRRGLKWEGAPAVDIVEKDKAFEVAAELPGLDEKEIEVKLVDGDLLIKAEKQEEKEEKDKDYYLRERHFGSFERRFRVPDGVDAAKVEASFRNGLLTVTLPKKPEAQKPEKKIEIKAA